jgi:cytochrome c biogenesis protein
MQPVTLEGAQVYLAGVRSDPSEAVQLPAHPGRRQARRGRMDAPARRAGRSGPARGSGAPLCRARPAAGPGECRAGRPAARIGAKTLAIFAGASNEGGFVAVSRFLERIPQAEQEKAANVFMKMLNGAIWELWQAARLKAGEPAAEASEANGRFLQLATNALSDSFFYGAPVYLGLEEFTEVKASVLQVTRSPGKKVVYLGCLLLVLGIFAMFYIRERRIWVWVRAGGEGQGAHALMAMSTQRKTLDFEREFDDLKTKLPQSA